MSVVAKKVAPRHKQYYDGIANEVYQLLTANLINYPGLMNIFLTSSYLKSGTKVIVQIVGCSA